MTMTAQRLEAAAEALAKDRGDSFGAHAVDRDDARIAIEGSGYPAALDRALTVLGHLTLDDPIDREFYDCIWCHASDKRPHEEGCAWVAARALLAEVAPHPPEPSDVRSES